MDWSIILCFVFANVIPSHGDDDQLNIITLGNDLQRRYSPRDLAKSLNNDYVIIQSSDESSELPPSEAIFPGHTLLRPALGMQIDRKKHRHHYRESRNFSSMHSQERQQERVLPPSDPDRPGHTLIQPTRTMLKSSAKYPRSDGMSLVYGSLDNLGITHGKTPYRVMYSGFRKANLMKLLRNLLRNSNAKGSLRRSRSLYPKKKLNEIIKTKTEEMKHKRKFKELDSNRVQKYLDSDTSNQLQNVENDIELSSKPKYFKRKNMTTNHDILNLSDEIQETVPRAFDKSDCGKYKIKPKPKKTTKKKKKKMGHRSDFKASKIVNKLNAQLDKKLKMSKLKKNSRKERPDDSYSKEKNSERSHNKKDKKSGYKREEKQKKHYFKKSKNSIFLQGQSKREGFEENNNRKEKNTGYKSDKKPKDKNENPKDKNAAKLVYGSPDNYGIVWGKTPYRTKYSDFRRTSNLLSKILEAYHKYKIKKNLKRALVAIRVWPLNKTKTNQNDLDTAQDELLENDASEIMDDVSIDIDDGIGDFRKQRKKSKTKSSFRNRDDNYDKGNRTHDCDGDDDDTSGSSPSDYEKNPGNPYTVFKNKYRQNWPWHFEMGDHINLNPFGPKFSNSGPNSADFFFNRKWWYFNQDDYIPLR